MPHCKAILQVLGATALPLIVTVATFTIYALLGNELTAAKQEEVTTLTSAIEDKITRVGESGLNIEDIKADSKDTAEKQIGRAHV